MKTANALIPHTSIRRVEADGVTVFYREAGPPNGPVILLLHGFPTSSFQYRELIPRLADRCRVIAPDLPGFGFTEVPEQRGYKYSFDALANTMLAFTDALRNASPPSFRKMGMRTKRVSAMPGTRSENTGPRPQQKTGGSSAKIF
jgi:alpha-beta hydrolase superfamily lysophospholipase